MHIEKLWKKTRQERLADPDVQAKLADEYVRVRESWKKTGDKTKDNLVIGLLGTVMALEGISKFTWEHIKSQITGKKTDLKPHLKQSAHGLLKMIWSGAAKPLIDVAGSSTRHGVYEARKGIAI